MHTAKGSKFNGVMTGCGAIPGERHQLLAVRNNDKANFWNDRCIRQLFEEQVLQTPDAVALLFGDTRMTYRELNGRANQLANYLRTLGVGPEVLVAVSFERSAEMVVGILAVLKAGGAYVPLDPAYPKERLTYMLEDSQAPVFLTQQRLAADLDTAKAEVVCIDSDWENVARESEENPTYMNSTSNLAYVIYTSGSTGKPKGVMITHGNLANYAQSLPASLGLISSDRYLHTASISFSSSVRQLMLPLSIGAAVVIATYEQIRDPLSLFELIRQQAVTVLDFVPSYWRSCLDALSSTSRKNERALLNNNVRLILSASEPLPADIPRELAVKFKPDVKMINMFGQTETTGIVCVYPINDPSDISTKTVPIGLPISDTRVYILDDDLHPAPFGTAGELYLGGNSLARGYLNLPELTKERFIASPLGNGSAPQIYKTGDLVRYLPTGEIGHVGRVDDQVKIRGFRVELGEIESAISANREVRQCVVIARQASTGDMRLIAYVVPRKEFSRKELRSRLERQLPDYMIPASIIELEKVPLTPNGKIDRHSLPIPDLVPTTPDRDFVEYRDTIEQRLVGIWEKLLGVRPIGLKDNFFELGGHSLLAIRMFAEVERTFGKSIPIGTLFHAGTIEKLSDLLRQDGWMAPESSLVPIRPDGTKPPFFCIHGGGGDVLFYRDLARRMPDDQPFYGIRAMRLGGRQVGHSTIEEMAEFYIKEIRTLQPEGPYYLGGSSLGGSIGLEMAQQLRGLGHEVALLALFDTWGPGYPKSLPGVSKIRMKVYDLVQRARNHRDKLMVSDTREKVDYFLSGVTRLRRKYIRKINNKFKRAVRKFYSTIERPIPENYIQIKDQIRNAWLTYQPAEYAGKITLFRAASQPLGVEPDPTLGWEGLASGGLELHEAPGGHVTIVAEPYVRVLAEELSRCIEKAQVEHDAGKPVTDVLP